MKILLVDDDPIVRECVESLVRESDGAWQAFVAGTLEQGVELACHHDDIGLVLLGLQQMRGRDAKFVSRPHAAHEHIPVVVLAATESEHVVLQSLNAGAMGFINKAASTRSLLRALRIAMRGGVCVPASVLKARGLYNRSQEGAHAVEVARWLSATTTDRQTIIAQMIRGRSTRAIAAALKISEATLRAEVSSFMKALSVTNRSELLLILASIESIEREVLGGAGLD